MKMLVYFMTILNILLPFGIFYGNLVLFFSHLVYYTHFGTYVCTKEIWQHWLRNRRQPGRVVGGDTAPKPLRHVSKHDLQLFRLSDQLIPKGRQSFPGVASVE
jgi:hypothetical protein